MARRADVYEKRRMMYLPKFPRKSWRGGLGSEITKTCHCIATGLCVVVPRLLLQNGAGTGTTDDCGKWLMDEGAEEHVFSEDFEGRPSKRARHRLSPVHSGSPSKRPTLIGLRLC
jgi:hypothetical protein